VTLKNLASAEQAASEISLETLLGTVADISSTLEHALSAATSLDAETGVGGTETDSLGLRIRADAIAACLQAYDRVGGDPRGFRRRVSLFELVEAGCERLTVRFAEVVAWILASQRSVQAMQRSARPPVPVSPQHGRVLLQRLDLVLDNYLAFLPREPGSAAQLERVAVRVTAERRPPAHGEALAWGSIWG